MKDLGFRTRRFSRRCGIVRRSPRLLLAMALAFPNPATATLAPTQGGARWYYHIGGADAVLPALNKGATTASLGGSLNLGMGLSCHGFDPVAGLTTSINQVADNLEGLVTNAVTGLVANAPMLILQRASPSLYELLQEMIGYANAMASLAVKSCEQMQSDMGHGQNPFDHWLTVSRSYSWKGQASNKDTDVLSALGAVESSGGGDGVPWVGGDKAGGDVASGQKPINVVSDTVAAGYNIVLGRGGTLDDSPADSKETRIAQLFGQPSEAMEYAVYVLGDITVRSGGPAATPGHGLLPKIETDREGMAGNLAQLVDGGVTPTPDNLAKSSPPGTSLTREVLDSIRKLPAGDRPVVIGKLAAEAATAANLEKALAVRRLLLSGGQEPHIYASPAGQDIERLVGLLDREIDQLLLETRVRKEIFAASAGTALDLGRGLDANGGGAPYRAGDGRPLEGSAVKP